MQQQTTTIDRPFLEELHGELPEHAQTRLKSAIEKVAKAKRRGGKIAVVTGSGPNLHEGVTTLIAELIRAGLVDGVTTSSAVVAHEMAGTLDRVKRVDGAACGLSADLLPMGGRFELTLMDDAQLDEIEREFLLDRDLIGSLRAAGGEEIIKAAGNMAYPMGYRTERIALDVLNRAKCEGQPFEFVAGRGCDPRTMLGAGCRAGAPVLVSIPQLVGGGGVGLAIGDSISITERAARVARVLAEADVIIESAVALTQEIHDGPFETYTGHGIWAGWDGAPTFSLKEKTIVRIDLDPNLEAACEHERAGASVQKAIDQGLPKTKMLAIPFRMEMSGFARLPNSIPVVGDIGVIWPLLALGVADELGVELEFMSYPQQSERGAVMRETIVRDVQYLDREQLLHSR